MFHQQRHQRPWRCFRFLYSFWSFFPIPLFSITASLPLCREPRDQQWLRVIDILSFSLFNLTMSFYPLWVVTPGPPFNTFIIYASLSSHSFVTLLPFYPRSFFYVLVHLLVWSNCLSLSVSLADVFCSRLIMYMFSIYTWNSVLWIYASLCVPRHSLVCVGASVILMYIYVYIKVHFLFMSVWIAASVSLYGVFVDHLFMNSSVISSLQRVCVHLSLAFIIWRDLSVLKGCKMVGGLIRVWRGWLQQVRWRLGVLGW